MQKNNKWFSLPLAMGLVMIISLLAYTILEYIVPFSREIKWVENSSISYYQANSWIEEGLYDVYTRNFSWAIEDTDEYFDLDFSWSKNSKYQTYSSWNILPPPWEGNSRYDPDWNSISQWNPIQLSIWNLYIDNDFEIAFRVPNLDNIDTHETLSWGTTLPIVNWQLSSSSNTLNASWSIIFADDILDSEDWFSNPITLWNDSWVTLEWNPKDFEDFYAENCWVWSWCVLKFSIINKLELDTDNVSVPYLEWRIDTGDNIIPQRYTKIESSWKSYWYKKDLEINVPWQTVNEAFDFTVFQ